MVKCHVVIIDFRDVLNGVAMDFPVFETKVCTFIGSELLAAKKLSPISEIVDIELVEVFMVLVFDIPELSIFSLSKLGPFRSKFKVIWISLSVEVVILDLGGFSISII